MEGLQNFGEELSARETDLEEYIPRDATLLPQIPALLLRHTQIRWSNWMTAQWGKTSEVPFPIHRPIDGHGQSRDLGTYFPCGIHLPPGHR